MASSDDDRSFPVEEIRAATANGHLPALAERLSRARDFVRLVSLFELTHDVAIPLGILTETVQRTAEALRGTALGRREPAEGDDDKRSVRLLAGEALLARTVPPPLTEVDRAALGAAAAILADGGDLYRAATTFELAGYLPAAAELWGRLGDLDAMESCLTREEERHRRARAAVGALRDVEALLEAGERVAALEVTRRIPAGSGEARLARQIAIDLDGRLLRARSVALLAPNGRIVRLAAAPATCGRDALADIPLRDPGVSRRHVVLALVTGGYTVTDADSRLGTFLGGARLGGPILLAGDAELQLGPSCRLSLRQPAPERVLVRGTSGLDSGVTVLVGAQRLPLDEVIPQAAGLWIEFDPQGVRLGHPPEISVRLGGKLASARIDLLRGDRLEVASRDGAPFTLEVP
ncbi:MAG TPA: FHA domain-containing protein [Polyangia bacterium]|jgi:hypothetical protein